jgi:hypothetical protein
MNKLVSNVCAFIYFQVTQLIHDCKEIKFPHYFSFHLSAVDAKKVGTIALLLVWSFGKSRNSTVECTTVFQQTHKSFGEVDQKVVSTIVYPILVIIKFRNLRK